MWLKGFIDYQRFRKKTPSGQIAALFTILIMVVFFLAIITINIGQIVRVKTQVSNAADSAALAMSSSLGSLAKIYCSDLPSCKICKTDWFLTFLPIKVAFDIITGNFVKLWLDFMEALRYAHEITDQMAAIKRKMANIGDIKDQIGETGIFSALSGLAADPNLVTDTHDYDEDGVTNDQIYYFTGWYNRRLDVLSRLPDNLDKKNALRAFLELLKDFIHYVGGKRDCYSVDDDGDGVIDRYVCAYDPALPWAEKGFGDWLADPFIPLLQEIESGDPNIPPQWAPIDVSFWQPGPDNDEVDELISEIDEFYTWSYLFLGYWIDPSQPLNNNIIFLKEEQRLTYPQDWLQGLYKVKLLNQTDPTQCFTRNNFAHDDTAYTPCYNYCMNHECTDIEEECKIYCEDKCAPDWHTRMGIWQVYAQKWITELTQIRDSIGAAIYVCGDVNGDGRVSVSDLIYLINYLFRGGAAPPNMSAADVNGDGRVTVSDVVYLQRYLFQGGPAPICSAQSAPDIVNRINEAITELGVFRDQVDAIRNVIASRVLAYYNNNQDVRFEALYAWAEVNPNEPVGGPDRYIWHFVRVTRSDFTVPEPRHKWRFHDLQWQFCQWAENRWGRVCVKVERYDSEKTHPLWRFVFHKGPPIGNIDIPDKDGDGLRTIDDIVKVNPEGEYDYVNKAVFDQIYGSDPLAPGILERYGMTTTAYACYGYRIRYGEKGIHLVPGLLLGSCFE